ncbi:hypothetical protein CNR22_05005 [Sphingobacteriaceae bacterium]|nr:hypothetical protein CNR22_05005 [Sphingobacteriaceae bacterium]
MLELSVNLEKNRRENQMDNYKFVRVSEENLFQLVSLYRESFNSKVSVDFLKKKFDTAAFGSAYIGFLALDNKTDEPAGYYGVFPLLAQIEGKEILVAQSGDTMTHPKHQGKGLFTELAKKTYILAQEQGIKFVFGFPNKNSFPGFKKKLNWQFYSDINNYTIKTGVLPFDKLAKKISFLKPLHEIFIKIRLKKYTLNSEFSNSLQKQQNTHGFIIHDAVFFLYKSYYNSFTVKIENVWCSLKIDGRLWVGDIDHCEKSQFFKVIEGLFTLAKAIGCSSVHLSLTNETLYDHYMKEKYVLLGKDPIGYINFDDSINPSKFAYNAIDFDTY